MNVTVRGRTQHFRTVTFDRAQNAVSDSDTGVPPVSF